jgi:hypothetical protein
MMHRHYHIISVMKVAAFVAVLATIVHTSSAFCFPSIASSRQGSSRVGRHAGPELVHTNRISSSSSSRRSSESHVEEQEEDDHHRHGYALARDAGPVHANCPLTEAQIHKTIAARRMYQRSREFDKADRLLEALLNANVFLHDKRREWRADGFKSFGLVPYIRRGAILLDWSEEDFAKIASLVQTRDRAKKERNFVRSDQLESQLMVLYNVQVDDKRREWWFVPKDGGNLDAVPYVPTPLESKDSPTHTMDEPTQSQIRQLLDDRAGARKSKNFGQADAILVELRDVYSAAVDDRTKEWKIVPDWNDASDPFVVDSKGSQRSAFARKHDERQPTDRHATVVALMDDDDDESEQSTSTMEEEDVSSIVTDLDASSTSAEDDTASPEVVVDATEEKAANSVHQDDEATLSKLTVTALKDKLRSAGLPVSGRKVELVDRLLSV